MTDKELIDYEIRAKKKASEKTIVEWCIAIFFGLIFWIVIGVIIGLTK